MMRSLVRICGSNRRVRESIGRDIEWSSGAGRANGAENAEDAARKQKRILARGPGAPGSCGYRARPNGGRMRFTANRARTLADSRFLTPFAAPAR
jgi:hypothetical protein